MGVSLGVGIAALVIGLVALGLVIRHEIDKRKVSQRVTKIALTRCTQTVNALIHLLAGQVKAASDGFIPHSFDELLSDKSAEMISLHLDISKEAPIVPKRTWRAYLAKSAQKFQEEVRQILNEYSEYLDSRIADFLAKLERSFFIMAYAHMEVIQQVDHQEGFQRQPVLALEKGAFTQDLQLVLRLVKLLNKKNGKHRLPLVVFPSSDLQREDVSPRLGCDRIGTTPKS